MFGKQQKNFRNQKVSFSQFTDSVGKPRNYDHRRKLRQLSERIHKPFNHEQKETMDKDIQREMVTDT